MSSPLTLFIDKSSSKNLIAIGNQDEILVQKQEEVLSREKENLFPFIETTLKEINKRPTDLTEIAVVNGPGSYTGLRISLAAVKGLALSLKISVKILNGFDVYACAYKRDNADAQKDFIVTIDSQRKDFFCQKYTHSAQKSEDPFTASEEELIRDGGLPIIGEYPSSKRFSGQDLYDCYSSGYGQVVTINELKPFYMRQTDFIKYGN